MQSSNKISSAADKKSNVYRLSKKEYSNSFQKPIISKYKKTDKHAATNINKEGMKHA